MSRVAGAGVLTRFALRRDRIRLLVWTVVLAVLALVTISSLEDMYPTPEDRAGYAATMENPTAIIFGGPGYGLSDLTLGPMVVAELLVTVCVAVAIMSVLLVVRHTRADEEAGRSELLRADVLGRAAPMAAALALCVITNVVVAGALAAVHIAAGLAVFDSLALGLGIALVGISFGVVAAGAAQVMEFGRASSGLALAVAGILFGFRVIGDISEPGGTWVSWLSPFAWGAQMRPFADLRWWPLLFFVVFIATTFIVAVLLAGRRDFGAGLVAPRRGRAEATRWLASPLALHLRLQRTAIIAWSIGTLAFGAMFGSLAPALEDMLAENPDIAEFFPGGADELTEGFLVYVVVYFSMAASAWAIVSVSRLKAEESAGRTEAVLATATARIAWSGSAFVVALSSAMVVLLAGGIGLGVTASIALGTWTWVGTALVATVGQAAIPALFAALTLLLFGLAPRLGVLAWGIWGVGVLISLFGLLFDLPAWAIDLSPFEMLAQVPLEDSAFGALALVIAGAVAALGAGLAGARHRDLVTG